MEKDQEMDIVAIEADATGGGSLVMSILEHWRGAWTDLSCTEAVIAQGPSFALWYSDTNGSESPGSFYPAEAIDRLIPPEEVREVVREHLDAIDHAREMTVVLVLKDEEGTRAAVAVIPKTAECKPQAWFEMAKLRKTSVAEKVWIPLRASSVLSRDGEYGYEGYLEEYFGVGSVMFDLEHRGEIQALDWGDIGIGNAFTGGEETHYLWPESKDLAAEADAGGAPKESQGGQLEQGKPLAAFRVPFTNLNLTLSVRLPESEPVKPVPLAIPSESVKPAEPERVTIYHRAGDWQSYRSKAVGTGLVIEQSFEGEAPSEWHLHQDFVISMGLQRQGDIWLRPAEGFQEVVRLMRNEAGNPVLLEVRTEHLRDYLKARGMYLLISSYRSRQQIVSNASHINWASELVEEVADGGQVGGTQSGNPRRGNAIWFLDRCFPCIPHRHRRR